MEKKPKPILPFSERMRLVKALKCVDATVPQETYSPLSNLKTIKPDIIMESESHSEEDLKKLRKIAKFIGCRIIIMPYYPEQSSTKIKNHVVSHWQSDSDSLENNLKNLKHKKKARPKKEDRIKRNNETRIRSAFKSFIWRITGVIILAIITYAYTRHLFQTTLITFLHHGIFLFVFYIHERIWMKIKSFNNIIARSLAKMFTYETLCGTIILGTITYLVTGSWKAMTAITLTYIGVKHVTYVFNEFIWKKIRWGKIEKEKSLVKITNKPSFKYSALLITLTMMLIILIMMALVVFYLVK
ncbi:hypothetical protein ES703_57764 [subsurface metagenome]